jgi:ornithine decarboxylase
VFRDSPSAASTCRWSIWAAASRPSTSSDVARSCTYGRSIFRALRKHFGNQIPETIIEPGRGMVGNAGIIEAEVVLISKKSDEDEVRWVYLDIGKFGGLAETMDESIRYAIRTAA